MPVIGNNKNLYVIVSHFPYGTGEPFFAQELEMLSSEFLNIHIIISELSSEFNEPPQYTIPENVNLHICRQRPFRQIDKLLSMRYFFSCIFWKEINSLRHIPSIKFNNQTLREILNSFMKAFAFRKELMHLIRETGGQAENSLLYTYWLTDKTLGIAFMKRKNCNFQAITRVHSWDLYFERSPICYLPMRSYIFNKLDAIFFISEHGMRYSKNKIRTNSQSVFLISRLGVFSSGNKIDTPTGSVFNIVSISRIEPVKRLDRIINALAIVEGIPIHWDHFGTGSQELLIKQMAHDVLNIKDNITYAFNGFVPSSKLMNILESNDYHVIINTSDFEGIPVSIMEAFSLGIPAIATAAGGTPEIVTNENGMLLSTDSTFQDIADAILQYYHLPLDIKIAKSNAAYNKWKNDFNAEVNYTIFANQLISL